MKAALNRRQQRRRRKSLTSRQALILAFIKRFSRRNGYMPTVQEIAENYGMHGHGAHCHLVLIERKGYIRRVPNISRGLVLL